MKFRKLVALITATSSLVGCGNNKTEPKEEKNIKIGMVSDVEGINDESFNQSAWEDLN